MANNYGNGKVAETKKAKTEVMFQVDSMEDISEQVQGKEILRTIRKFGKEYHVYSKTK